jgi:hypothetical protein
MAELKRKKRKKISAVTAQDRKQESGDSQIPFVVKSAQENHDRKPSCRELCSVFREVRSLGGRCRFLGSSIALELRNVLSRIQTLFATNACLLGYLGPAWIKSRSSARLLRCEATLARSLDMQDMLSSHRTATAIDADLFLEGWEAGARWAASGDIRIPGYRSEHKKNLASRNVIPQLDAIQAYKLEHGWKLSKKSAA